MKLEQLKQIFAKYGCEKIYVKNLSANDNSKNQVYLAGNFDILNVLPIADIVADSSGDWKRDRFKASLNFYWIDQDDYNLYPAPKAQLILYPKYPEVRFSGFLAKCEKAPSSLMTQRLSDRLLFLSTNDKSQVIGFVTAPDSSLAIAFHNMGLEVTSGVFKVWDIQSNENEDSRDILLTELKRIHELGWINAKRLNTNGQEIGCEAPQCGGYTLEAELGIIPNGFSKPDFLDWEIKQFGVNSFDRIGSKVITLMTPEPTGGFYKDQGVEVFLRTYGYPDKNGIADRINFGGAHKADEAHKLTGLTLKLIGFDRASGKIRNANGKIVLIDHAENEVASWAFTSLIKHWNKKHHRACYVPSMVQKNPTRQYKYSNRIILGMGADFQLFLKEFNDGNIYYDPGIKMENASTKPQIKRRSQFRMKSKAIKDLYIRNEEVDLTS